MVRRTSVLLFLIWTIAFPLIGETKTWVGHTIEWSFSTNWSDRRSPVDGDDLVFPDGAGRWRVLPDRGSRIFAINDIPRPLAVRSVSFPGASPYAIYYGAVVLSDGITTKCCKATTWLVSTRLAQSQTFTGGFLELCCLDLNGQTLTFWPMSFGYYTDEITFGFTGPGKLIVMPAGTLKVSGAATLNGTIELRNGQLFVPGSISSGTITGTGALFGAGTIPDTELTNSLLRPGIGWPWGTSPGTLTTGSLTLAGGVLSIDVQSPLGGQGQILANGTVTLQDATLFIADYDVKGSEGQTFILVRNDGTDPVQGHFSGLEEGTLFGAAHTTFQITYRGGDGNDIAVTLKNGPRKTWTGAINNLWSVAGNWSDGRPPADGDRLVFSGGLNVEDTINDLAGLDLAGITFENGVYKASGNAVTLRGGLSMDWADGTWDIPTTLTERQSFGGPRFCRVTLGQTIDLNHHDLTVRSDVTATGSIVGTGKVVVLPDASLALAGTASFDGQLTILPRATLTVTGAITGPPLVAGGEVNVSGALSDTTLEAATVRLEGSIPAGDLSITNGTACFDITGTPGAEYDQIAVTGTVTLSNPALSLTVTPRIPRPGQTFILISNDGVDPTNGTFADLPEGAVLTVSTVPLRITYKGGDGNDVVLTVQSGAPKTWTGAVSNSWSVGENWNDWVVPADGDSLVFPGGAANRDMTNDLPGLELASIAFTAKTESYGATGMPIALSRGFSATAGTVTWSVPTKLAASQALTGANGLNLAGPIDLNGYTLSLSVKGSTLAGSIEGTGDVVLVEGATLNLTGSTTFSGTFTLSGATLNVTGSMVGHTLTGRGIVQGSGHLPVVDLRYSTIRAAPAATLDIQALFLKESRLEIPVSRTAGVINSRVVRLDDVYLEAFIDGDPPAPGKTFTVLSNEGSGPISVIAGPATPPEGSKIATRTIQFRVTYTGGDGNDIVLRALAPTSNTLSQSRGDTLAGESFIVTVTATSPFGTPSGLVTLQARAANENDGTAIPFSPIVFPMTGTGISSTNLRLPAAKYWFSAELTADGDYGDSRSLEELIHYVRPGKITVTLTSAPAVGDGEPLIVGVDCQAISPATGSFGGTVDIKAEERMAWKAADARGHADVAIDWLRPGTHTFLATCSGDSNFVPAAKSAVVEVLSRISFADVAVRPDGSETNITLDVQLSSPSPESIRVAYSTADATAIAGVDYVPTSGTLEFPPGVTTRTIPITLMVNSGPARKFRVVFTNAEHALLARSEAIIELAEVDAIPTLGLFALILLAIAVAVAGWLSMKT